MLLGGDALAHSIADSDAVPFPPTAAARSANPVDTTLSASPAIAGDPGEHEASAPWLSHGPLPLPAIPWLDADESDPPFTAAARMLTRKPDRPAAPNPTDTRGGSSLPATTGLLPGGEDVLANLNNLQQAVTELIVETTDARVGPGGRVSFSLAGVDNHDAGPPLRVIELITEVLAYPLVWVLAVLLLAGKMALMIAARRARKHRHRRRPVIRQQEAPQRVRKRVRIRIRQRQPVVGLQQPR